MPSFDIVREITARDTFRVQSVVGAFDLQTQKISEHFSGNIDIEEREWNIGLIVGSSGSGKSTIARECFPDSFIDGFEYNADSVIDDMPKGKTQKEITKAFTSVGFASPPSWLKPYRVLSNGEKMRCDLARSILEENQVACFDEFTSVVNREVAKTGSYAISKAVRKMKKKFIAVSCHYDIKEWLEPDWIFDTDKQEFFFAQTNSSDPKLNWKYSEQKTRESLSTKYGQRLGNIII